MQRAGRQRACSIIIWRKGKLEDISKHRKEDKQPTRLKRGIIGDAEHAADDSAYVVAKEGRLHVDDIREGLEGSAGRVLLACRQRVADGLCHRQSSRKAERVDRTQ